MKYQKVEWVYRDEPILLFFSPIFLSGNSFFLAYCAQYIACSCNILLQVQLHDYMQLATEQ